MGEGFFLAAFQNQGSSAYKKQKPQQLQLLSKMESQQLSTALPLSDGLAYFHQSGAIRAIPEQWIPEIGLLASHLYIKKAGVDLGSQKGKDLVPAHELALSGLIRSGFPIMDLSLADALLYLKRKEFASKGEIGWNLVHYCGLPLGWVKVLSNRINNYYPAEWRILKD
jgi:NOL1/NOP2/fmu family ribosome biogenesis protein